MSQYFTASAALDAQTYGVKETPAQFLLSIPDAVFLEEVEADPNGGNDRLMEFASNAIAHYLGHRRGHTTVRLLSITQCAKPPEQLEWTTADQGIQVAAMKPSA